MTFHIGQKVICVNATPVPGSEVTGLVTLRRGSIYAIRFAEIWDGLPCVRLIEIINPLYEFSDRGWLETAYRANRFRPVVERKTDISIFKEMFVPKREDA